MKKILCSVVLTLAAVAAMAQSTTIRVTLQIEKQSVRVGPYARYAQKYLGIVAPLADKQSVTITQASLLGMQEDQRVENQPIAVNNTPADLSFPSLPVDRSDFTTRSGDEAARAAASTIFSLRKARLELITGTAGENVFGDGLRAALEEIDRLEAEYLALFMGKQATETSLKSFDVVPARGENSRVVCRFSAADGILAADDLTGDPLVLEFKTAGPINAPAPAAAKPSKKEPATVRTLLPAQVDCRLVLGSEALASARVAVYQMGVYADIPQL